MNNFIKHLCTGILVFAFSCASLAANFVIVNNDAENEGLNDPRPVIAINGNTATTLGEQRRAVISAALAYIGDLLLTDLEFSVRVQFDPLECDADTALLGGGAPVDTFVDFVGAPKANTQYPSALANLHAGYDLDPASPELELIFNGSIDFNDLCLADTQLYYGLDAAEPEGTVNFYSIVLHEIVHALGFLTFMDEQGSTPYNYSDPFMSALFNPIFGRHLDESGSAYSTVYERHPIVFFGQEIRFRTQGLTQGVEFLARAMNGEKILAPYIYTPDNYSPSSSFSHWDISLSPQPLMAPFADEPVISLSDFELAALKDIGWPVALPVQDRDGDGVTDPVDGWPDDSSRSAWPAADANRNNLPDVWEAQHGLEWQADNVFIDRDVDGVSNIREYMEGTNPLLVDSDGDGLGDWGELLLGFNPVDASSCPTADCNNLFDRSVPPLAFDLDYFIHEDVSPLRVAPSSRVASIRPALDKGLFVSGFVDASGGHAEQVEGRLVKLNNLGALDSSFGRMGTVTTKDIGSPNGNSGSIIVAEDSQGRLYYYNTIGFKGLTRPQNVQLNYYHLVWEYSIHRLLPSGEQDHSFPAIAIESAGINPVQLALAVDHQDRLVVAYETYRAYADILDVEIKRYLPSGNIDESFADKGLFAFRGTHSLRIGGVYFSAQNDLFLPAYYFGLPQFTGNSVLKITAAGVIASDFGSGILPGFLSVTLVDKFTSTEDGFVLFERIDDPAKHHHERLIRVRQYTNSGSLERERIIDSLPADALNELSCESSLTNWVCVVATSWGHDNPGTFVPDTYYAQVFDQNFNALGVPKAQPKIKFAGMSFDSENLIGIAHTSNNNFLLVSQLNGNSGINDGVGIRRFSVENGWDSQFGEQGLASEPFRGAAEQLSALKVDEQLHTFVSFAQKQNKVSSNVKWQAGILHFFPNGERDTSFGRDGFLPVPSAPEGTTLVTDIVLDSNKNLILLAVTDFNEGNPGDRLQIYRVDRLDAHSYRYSHVPTLIYEAELDQGKQYFGAQLLVLQNDELMLKYTKSTYFEFSKVYVEPSVHLHHMDNRGKALDSIWDTGHYLVANYPGLQTYTQPNIYGLQLNENKALWFNAIVPPEVSSEGTRVQFIELLPTAEQKGVVRTQFTIDPYVFVDGVLPLFEQDKFFVYGSSCLAALKCEQSYFGYYAIVDNSGNVVEHFNSGQPTVIYQGRRENVAARYAYRTGNDILVTATMDLGFYARGGSDEHPDYLKNAGNGFYAIAFSASGQVLGAGPFTESTSGLEIYGDCQLHSGYSGTCGVYNDHYTDVRLLRWADPSRLPDPLADTDGDGIPDHIENTYGLNPHSQVDARADLDGDGIANVVEYRRATNMAFDDVAPALNIPADVHLIAIGAYTPVNPGSASAIDTRDGAVTATAESLNLYPPGRHELVWAASDANGNRSAASQFINITPLASIVSDVALAPESHVYLRAALNGPAPQYPVVIPLDTAAIANSDFYIESHNLYFSYGEMRTRTDIRHRINGQTNTLRIPMRVDNTVGAAAGSTLESQIQVLPLVIQNHEITITQNQQVRSTIVSGNGPVNVSLTSDLSKARAFTIDWGGSDSALLSAATSTTSQLNIDPSLLADGVYRIVATIAAGTNRLEKTDLLRVVREPTLSLQSDSDSDGISDWDEGNADENGNRVVNYLDPDSRPFLLPMSLSHGDFMQTDAVLNLRLGAVAFTLGLDRPLVNAQQIEAVLGVKQALPAEFVPQSFDGKLFEFEITGLGSAGGRGEVVIPTRTALPQRASLFRLSALAGWQALGSKSDELEIASAPKISGVCPAGQHISYTPGLTAGNSCIRLVLQDGGSADFDSALDGTIRFIGGVYTTQTPVTSSSSSQGNSSGESSASASSIGGQGGVSGGGSGGGILSWALALLLLSLLFAKRYCEINRCKLAEYLRGLQH